MATNNRSTLLDASIALIIEEGKDQKKSPVEEENILMEKNIGEKNSHLDGFISH